MFVLYAAILVLLTIIAILIKFNKIRSYWLGILFISSLATLITCSYLYDFISDKITEPITLTATEKMNEFSEGNEVWLNDVVINGRRTIVQFSEGSWIQKTRMNPYKYGWRGYDKPIGTTNTVTIQIPLGKDRRLEFEHNKWRGIVTIEQNGEINEVDLYYPTENQENQKVVHLNPPSQRSTMNKALILALTGLLVGVFFSLVIYFMTRHADTIKAHMTKHGFIWFALGVSLIMFLISVQYSYRSMGFDDLAQVYFSHPSLTLREMIYLQLKYDVHPPLFAMISTIWLRIYPYGTMWMKVPSEAAVAAGIFLCGIIGKKLHNTRMGVLALICAAGSSSIVLYAAHTYRPYGILILFSAAVIFFYLRRNQFRGSERLQDIILYGISLLLLMYSHYFGFFICIALFFVDAYYYSKNMINTKCIFSYILSGVLFAPWLLLAFRPAIELTENFSRPSPNLEIIINIVRYITNFQPHYLFVLSMIVAVTYALVQKNNDKKHENAQVGLSITETSIILCWCIGFVFSAAFIYSTYVNPAGSVFEGRYFLALSPFIILLSAMGVEAVCSMASNKETKRSASIIICVLFSCLVVGPSYQRIKTEVEKKNPYDYEVAAEFVMQRDDIHNDNVLTLLSSIYIDGWDYYLTHNGRREGIVRMESNGMTREKLDPYDRIYVVEIWRQMNLGYNVPVQAILDTDFHIVEKYPDVFVTVYERNS